MLERYNPQYRELLQNTYSLVKERLRAPVTHAEKDGLFPIHEDTTVMFVRRLGGIDMGMFPSGGDSSRYRNEWKVIHGMVAPTLRANEEHRLRRRDWQDMFGEKGPIIKEMDQIYVFPVTTADVAYSKTQTLGVFGPQAVAAANVLQVVSERVYASRADFEPLKGHPMYSELARVKQSEEGDIADTFAEGFLSVAQAHSQIAADLGDRGIDIDKDTLKLMITRYTAALPHGGLMGPMALRGEYFSNLFTSDGELNKRYVDFFASLRGDEKVDYIDYTLNHGERCPALGIVLKDCLDVYFSVLDQVAEVNTVTNQFTETTKMLERNRLPER